MDRQDHPARSRSSRRRTVPLAVLFWMAAVGLPAVAQDEEATESAQVDFSTWTDQEMEAFLSDAETGRREETDVGVNRTLRIELEKDGITHDAHFTNVNVDKPREEFSNGTVELNFKDTYKFNIAAYRLDRLIHLNMVPVSIERRISGERSRGALTWWVDDVQMMELERRQQDIKPPDPQSWSDQMNLGGRIFTALTYNSDPNQGNFLITDDWDLRLIDFTRAFRLYKELPDNVNLGARIPRRVYEGLKALDADTLEEAMEDFLDSSRRKALLARRDLIVQHFDEQIAKFGEDEVFWDEPGQ